MTINWLPTEENEDPNDSCSWCGGEATDTYDGQRLCESCLSDAEEESAYDDDWDDEDEECPGCGMTDVEVYENDDGFCVCEYCDSSEDEDLEENQQKEEKSMTEPCAKHAIPHIISGNSITVFHEGVHTFPSSHLFYKEICEAVKAKDVNKLTQALNKKNCKEGIELRDDKILWNGEPLHGTAVERLFAAKAEGFDTTPIVNFLKNCQANPYPECVAKLYDFLETREMPITEDGCFLAYKYTTVNYWDQHTGKTYQFLPYTHVEDPNRCDYWDKTGQECSEKGIHVGNFAYSGSQPTVVFVKVNPSNVLSVPCTQYGNAKKIRVWALDVLGRTDGKKLDASIVTNKGEAIPYIKGNRLECKYKSEHGKILHLEGDILNVGNTYIELDAGYSEYDKDGEWSNDVKRRLKISNIIEIL